MLAQMKKKRLHLTCLFILLLCFYFSIAQHTVLWHGKEKTVRYQPKGQDFVIQNGKLRFNRALYGSNTAFRAEAGDLPEFALYMPGMGGNLKFGWLRNDSSKWLLQAQ